MAFCKKSNRYMKLIKKKINTHTYILHHNVCVKAHKLDLISGYMPCPIPRSLITYNLSLECVFDPISLMSVNCFPNANLDMKLNSILYNELVVIY